MRLIKRNQYSKAIAILTTGVVALIIAPSNGVALPECPTPAAELCDSSRTGYYSEDCDMDGITDQDECEGFTTFGFEPLVVPGFTSGNSMLNPATADLFYAVTDASKDAIEIEDMPESLILGALTLNPDALAFYADGVKVSTHRIKLNNSGPLRTLFPDSSLSTARLAWIKESLCVDGCEGDYLGSTPQGVPSEADVNTTIYSKKIQNDVYAKYSRYGKSTVAGTNLNTPDEVVNYYILQVISHEMGHGSLLAAPPATAKSYYHYRRSNTIMDPSVSFSKGVYTIPVEFHPEDSGAAKLVR